MSRELEKTFGKLRKGDCEDKRLAGEYAYVLAVKYKDTNSGKSRYYAQECLKIFEELDIKTLEDAASRLNVVDGVCLPEYIHEKVIRERFQEMEIL